jgi:2-dehydropantoate 2-reductase
MEKIMNIVVFGAGAIGSLLGGLLSKNNNVVLIGRKHHVDKINEDELKISGLSEFNDNIKAYTDIKKINFTPDLVLLTVKSYDTENAIKKIKCVLGNNTIILSFQNGLNNLEIINQYVPKNQIIFGITTHGSIYVSEGHIKHTGKGYTIIGGIDKECQKLNDIKKIFDEIGIITQISNNIEVEIWKKALINSSINPLTTIFKCENGYLLKNPILKHMVICVCKESTEIAKKSGFNFEFDDILVQTFKVIEETTENKSSMLQSYLRKTKTEISHINGKLIENGKKNNVSTYFNELLIFIIEQQT